MELTLKDITKIWNQAIKNETGFEGNIGDLFSFEEFTLSYSSKDDRTIIRLNEVKLIGEPDLTTVCFINTDSENPVWNYAY